MSVAKLLVLGAVIEHGVTHGYQVRKEVESWCVDLWGGLGQGSIYHALRQLSSHGLLEAVGVEKQSSAPHRAIYRATAEGQSAFRAMLEEMLASADTTPGESMAAIGLLTALTRARALELLEQRIRNYEAKRDRLSEEYESLPQEEWGHHAEAIRLWIGSAQADIDWAVQLVKTLRRGAYEMADDKARHGASS